MGITPTLLGHTPVPQWENDLRDYPKGGIVHEVLPARDADPLKHYPRYDIDDDMKPQGSSQGTELKQVDICKWYI